MYLTQVFADVDILNSTLLNFRIGHWKGYQHDILFPQEFQSQSYRSIETHGTFFNKIDVL